MGTAKNSPENINVIRRVLQREKFPPMAIAATLARLGAESRFDPRAINKGDAADGTDSIGMNQWNMGRLANLRAYAKKKGTTIDDVETQAEFYAKEVKGGYGGQEATYGKKLLAATTPDEAAKATISLARPGGWTPQNPERGLGYADTLATTIQFAAGNFNYKGGKGKTSTGATAADYLPPNDRGLMQGSKSAGRTAEEGDQPLMVPDLTGIADLAAGEPLAPIDNTPEGKIKQIMAGIGSAMQAGADKTAEDLKNGPKTRKYSLSGDIAGSGTNTSPSVAKIFTEISRMGR